MSKQPDTRPHFVDNRGGNTLDARLRAYLRALREGQQAGNVDIATAYFNLPGFDLLADEFGKTRNETFTRRHEQRHPNDRQISRT